MRGVRAFAIAIGCPRPDEITVLLLRYQCRAGLLRNILAVNLIDEIFQWNEIPIRAPLSGEGLETVIYGNETHPQEWKNALQVVSGFLIITAEAG